MEEVVVLLSMEAEAEELEDGNAAVQYVLPRVDFLLQLVSGGHLLLMDNLLVSIILPLQGEEQVDAQLLLLPEDYVGNPEEMAEEQVVLILLLALIMVQEIPRQLLLHKDLLEVAQFLELEMELKLEQEVVELVVQEEMQLVILAHLHLQEMVEEEKYLAFLELMFAMPVEVEEEELKILMAAKEVAEGVEPEAMFQEVEIHLELQELLIQVVGVGEHKELLQGPVEDLELLLLATLTKIKPSSSNRNRTVVRSIFDGQLKHSCEVVLVTLKQILDLLNWDYIYPIVFLIAQSIY